MDKLYEEDNNKGDKACIGCTHLQWQEYKNNKILICNVHSDKFDRSVILDNKCDNFECYFCKKENKTICDHYFEEEEYNED